MKYARKLIPLIAIISSAVLAAAQSIPQGTFKHIIIIVQENRTPDNLFGAGGRGSFGCAAQDDFETGVDIENGGHGYAPQQNGTYELGAICNGPLRLNGWDASLNGGNGAMVDPSHTNEGWDRDYLGYEPGVGYTYNLMTGFCWEFGYTNYGSTCPSYSYVQQSDVQPYFDIATAYGFANYMFQSNEGPSQPAHQFLFTGTSAPVDPSDTDKDPNNNFYHDDFVADLINANPPPYPQGCLYTNSGGKGWPPWIQPDGTEISDPRQDPSECYAHDSLVTDVSDCGNEPNYCDRSIPGQSHTNDWAYYVEPNTSKTGPGYSIWDAPANIPEVCYGAAAQYGSGNPCGAGPNNPASTEWFNHVRAPQGTIPYKGPYTYSWAPIFDDILNCELPAISWVIPDQAYSDHPYSPTGNPPPTVTSVSVGPSWVGDIVDVIGQSYTLTNQGCDYWGVGTGSTNPQPTAIFVVWDDWGGWYDHIDPWIARRQGGGTGFTDCDDPTWAWGCGYTDGFRVPLLVVSPYTTARYVSGACGAGTSNGPCPYFGAKDVYVHDFGSILAFTEWNFAFNPPFIYGSPTDPTYADYNAPDWGGNPGGSQVPLLDFFGQQGRSFTPISTTVTYSCFQEHLGGSCVLAGWQAEPPDDY